LKKFVISVLVFLIALSISASPGSPFQYKWVQLNNGMPVLLIPVKENPVISSTIVMKVGLKYENKEHNGVSHLLEHLMFNGTTKRTQKQLYDDLDRAGCYSNASTGDHYTAYYTLCSKENFAKALEIQSDMIFHSTLPENKVPKEKSIVIQEIQRDKMSPSYEEGALLRHTLFPASSYGMKVLGDADSVKRIPREEILKFYHKYYAPSNAVAVIVGDFYYRVFQCARVGSEEFGAQEIGVELLDRGLKQKFSAVDSRISCSTVYTADYGLVEIRARVKDEKTALQFDRELSVYLKNFKVSSADVREIANRMVQETVFSLERPHFFGMLFAPQIAAGLKNPLYPLVVSDKSVGEFIRKLNGECRSLSLLINGREEKQ